MSVSTRSIGEALGAIAGREQMTDDARRLAAAAVDGVTPRWAVRPRSLAQVAQILALASDAQLAVVPRGSGSALGYGRPAARVDLVLDMAALDAVVEWSPEDLTISVGAGLTLGGLATHLAARRQMLPLDPPGGSTRTLGGVTATNASGPLRVRYGTLRDLLLGVRFVQADGVVTWGGARVVKSVSGYDVPRLMVGALGTLGVLGELTLRLHPVPDSEATWLVLAPGFDEAQAFLAQLLDSSVQPSRVELLNRAAARAWADVDAAAAVAVSIGTVAEAVRAQGAVVADFAQRCGGEARPLDPRRWLRWDEVALGSGAGMILRVATVVPQLAATVLEIERLSPGCLVTGCAALGTLRAVVAGGAVSSQATLVERLRALVAESDGSVIVERAPRELRERVDPWGPLAPGPLALMRAIRDEFDPGRVLNGGRFVDGL